MSACETCWSRAQSDVLLMGGSVPERYRQRVEEQRERETHPHTTTPTPAGHDEEN